MRKFFINKQTTMRKSMSTLFTFLLLFCASVAFGQSGTVTGIVTDVDGEPLIGVNVTVKGTTTGITTGIDGGYSLQPVTNQSILVFSYVGYIAQEIPLGNNRTINVQLLEDLRTLDEVVVVGYGTQVRRDISASITTVSAEDLKEIPVATFAEALMGMAAGVFISTTGAPGSQTTMRIRGVGSVNAGAAGPLVIVDGISNVDVNTINPNDIESFSILKDASATAIYGARGANGVILITTKQGLKDSGRVRVTYDGYIGLSTMANNGYDIMDAWEQMEFIQQGMINARDIRGVNPGSHAQFGTLDANDKLSMPYAIRPAGYSQQQIIDRWGSVEAWVASYQPNGTNSWMRSAYAQMLADGYSEAEARKGTDWYNLVTQTGLIQNHSLSLQGGNGEKGMYSVALGVNTTEGTIKESYFNRYSLRVNSIYHPTKYLTFGFNVNLAVTENGGDRGGNSDGGGFGRTLTTQNWIPVYAVDGINFAGTQASDGGRNRTPMVEIDSYGRETNRNFNGQASVYAELKPLTNLVIRTQYAPRMSGQWETSFSPITIMHDKEGRSDNSYSETARHSFSWQWTNTVNYNTTFNVDHSVSVVAGVEAVDENRLGRNLTGTRRDYIFENDPNTWTVSNGNTAQQTNSGSISTHTTLFGYFGRAEYSYKGTYIVTGSVRRDASSRFAEANRWGTFPSISGAWRLSDEAFMQPTRSYIDDLKIRVGYGTTGNSNTGNDNAYNWAFPYGTSIDHAYDVAGANNSIYTGFGATALGDANAKWETVRSVTLGTDITALNQRLTVNFEWYTRQTTDMLVAANWSSLAGSATKPRINIGDMSNKGVELTVGWRERKRNFNYNISFNLSTYRNFITRLGSADIFQGSRIANQTITTSGQPIGMYYGYKVLGIYKNVDDVLNYQTNGQTVLPYGAPGRDNYNPQNWVGRFIIEDVNGDGAITADDRTIIGNPHPDFSGGFNASIGYGNWDLSTQIFYQYGNDMIAQFKFYTHYGALQAPFARERRDLSWHPVTNPEGTLPLWALIGNEGDEAANQANSSYIEDGSYLRMRNLTLGYSLPRNTVRSIGLERVRLYLQVSNLFVLTKYSGLEPEVRTSNEMNRGLDFGAYGQPRQYIFGVNISFQ